ncbi:hypothetical protein QUF50_03570 [Thiotrichales bacterium HSG1]|nr:hypothetical protein [Thiotrichales bacterium HSG1]
MISWHRLLGLTLMDFFTDSCFEVELEKDLTSQEQFLDILIIRKTIGQPPSFLPDGLEGLSKYNLLTYKSMREPLNSWTMKELVGSSVIYRKEISPSTKNLLPESEFKLYAVCTNYPQKLANMVAFEEIMAGVYDVLWGTDLIRVIVTSRLDKQNQNAIFLLFSGRTDSFKFGNLNYKWHSFKAKGLLNQLYDLYFKEGTVMSYTWDDFHREYTDKFIDSLPPEERLRGLQPEERLEGLPHKELLKVLQPEERLEGLSPEVIEEYLAKLKQQ